MQSLHSAEASDVPYYAPGTLCRLCGCEWRSRARQALQRPSLGFTSLIQTRGAGDKSNHVATIHLAQMLYIWPLFAFFSAPLFLSLAAQVISYASRILFP